MLPDLGAEFAPDMNMIRVVPTATSEFGPSFSQMLAININFVPQDMVTPENQQHNII